MQATKSQWLTSGSRLHIRRRGRNELDGAEQLIDAKIAALGELAG
jgi:hypothetical protein